jgi:hypothetical protein
MIQDYDGAEVVDAQGERIGTVGRSYVDDSGTTRFVEVTIGAFFPKHRLVPLAGAQMTSGRLVVPYTIDKVMESPDASPASDTLEGELLEQVQAHYALDRASADVEMAGSIEEIVPVVPGEVVIPEPASDTTQRVVEEEVVVVKRRVLRVRKGQVIAHETIPATVHREPVEVLQDGDIVVRGEQDNR